MQLLGIPWCGGHLVADPGDGGGVECGQIAGVDRQAASQCDGPAAPLLERGVVEEGVGVGVEDLVRQHGEGSAVSRDRQRITAPRRFAAGPAREPVDVHRLVQAVARWSRCTSGWSGSSTAPPPWLSWQAACAGKHRRQQIVARMRMEAAAALRPPPRMRSTASARVGVPAPAHLEHRALQRRLAPASPRRCRGERSRSTVVERKAVLRPEREQHRVVGGRRLQLEVEGAAEALAQRQAPAPD